MRRAGCQKPLQFVRLSPPIVAAVSGSSVAHNGGDDARAGIHLAHHAVDSVCNIKISGAIDQRHGWPVEHGSSGRPVVACVAKAAGTGDGVNERRCNRVDDDS